MKDRVSAYPGRVKLTPVSGQTNVYDLERWDSPTEPGTPLNKANLLSDAVAEFLGLTNTAVPNDAFQVLRERQKVELRFESIETSGTWTVPSNLYGGKIFAVAVGGGGGGGKTKSSGWYGGAGGSGHLIFGTLSVTAGQQIPVVIGAGGAVASSYSVNGSNGGATTFMGYTANGGEGGGSYASAASPIARGGDGGAGGASGSSYSNTVRGGHGSFGGGGSSEGGNGGNGGTYGGGGASWSGNGGTGGTYGGNGGKVNVNTGTGTNNTRGTDYLGAMEMWNLAADYYGVKRPYIKMATKASEVGVLAPLAGGGGLGSSGGGKEGVTSSAYPGGGGGFLCNGGWSYSRVYGYGGGLFCSLPLKSSTNDDDQTNLATIPYRGGGGFFALGGTELRGAGGQYGSSGETGNGGNGVVGIWYYITPTNYLSEDIV